MKNFEVNMATSSSDTGQPKRNVFSVPSIDEITAYEEKRPKLVSNFKSKRVARVPSHTAASAGAAPKPAAGSSKPGTPPAPTTAIRHDGGQAAGTSTHRSPQSSPAGSTTRAASIRTGRGGGARTRSPPPPRSSSPSQQSRSGSRGQRESRPVISPTTSRTRSVATGGQGKKSPPSSRGSQRGSRVASFQPPSSATFRSSPRSQRPDGSTAVQAGSGSRIQGDRPSAASSAPPSSFSAVPAGPPAEEVASVSNPARGEIMVTSATSAEEGQDVAEEGQHVAGAQGTAGPRGEFTTAMEFVRSRGKIGAAFADKFRMLGTAEEYQMPQASTSTNQPAGDSVRGAAAVPSKVALGNCVVVNPRQRGNPILKHIRNVPWEFGDIVPDYVMGRTTCALYLSLRYHHLNPNYIHDRLTELGHKFELRVLLVQVDVKDPHHSVKELARMAILTDCTLILAWSSEEAGRYLETYKAYENKPADALKEKIEQDHLSKMTDCLTTVKSVNRTDVITLLANYGTFEKMVAASKEELSLLPGFGTQKAQRLTNMFSEPFLRKNKRRKVQAATGGGEGGEEEAQTK